MANFNVSFEPKPPDDESVGLGAKILIWMIIAGILIFGFRKLFDPQF